jgi:phage tail-like protein
MTTLTHSRYLQHLPAIFHKLPKKPEELVLGEFLLSFEQELKHFEDILAIIDRYFSPALLDARQAEEFLPWLASWVALTLDEEWDEDKRRRLIFEAIKLYRWRGTVQGLKRYLEIYTGLDQSAIDIHEGRWPGGMQIGVASRIGGVIAQGDNIPNSSACSAGAGLVMHDYYLVSTVAPTAHPPGSTPPDVPEGAPLQLYYCADLGAAQGFVERVQIEETGVRLWYRGPNQQTPIELFHQRPPSMTAPNITRSSGWIDYCYTRFEDRGVEPEKAMNYHGGSFLIEQVELPYRFIVEIHESASGGAQDAEEKERRLAKVQSIIDLEKPAHTEHYLKFSPVVLEATPTWMQIEVRSSIGIDTAVG